MPNRLAIVPAAVLAALLLPGCDMLGIESPEKVAAARDAEGRAVGGACRHAARAIEDCYMLNKKAEKAAVFAGWRDMNDYMRENKIEPVAPQLAASATKLGMGKDDEANEAKADSKGDAKPTAKAGESRKPGGAKAHES